MMRTMLTFALCAGSAISQPFSLGVKGGVPVNNLTDTGPGAKASYAGVTNRYLIGPTVDVKIRSGLSIEADALYRHFRYAYFFDGAGIVITNGRAVANDWEFPLLAKYRFRKGVVRPYVDAGIAWDWVSGRTSATTITYPVTAPGPPVISSGSANLAPDNGVVPGFVMGGGLQFLVGLLHISPEVRFTRWLTRHFTQDDGEFGILNSSQNQVEVMVGITFGRHE